MTDYRLINDVCKMREENRQLKTQLSRIWLMLNDSDYVKSRPKEEIVSDVKGMIDALPRKEKGITQREYDLRKANPYDLNDVARLTRKDS